MGKVSVEFCGSHFANKMTKNGRDKYLKTEYKQNPLVKQWCDEMVAIRFVDPKIMEKRFKALLEAARTKFNKRKKGRGTKHSLFRKCVKYWEYADKVFVNGTHSTVYELSCYHRLDDRSNQAMEASNKDKNRLIKRLAIGNKVRGEDWLALAARLEKKTMNRLHQLKNHRDWKKKNTDLIKKDKAYKTVGKQLKKKKITQRQYMKKIVKISTKRRIDSSDSE